MNGKRIVLRMLALALLLSLFPFASSADNAIPRQTVRYDGNGGVSEAFGTVVDRRISGTHLRENTLLGTSYFHREGYVQTGWNTLPDGSGTHTGLGSRVTFSEGLILYAEWAKASDRSLFMFRDGTVVSYAGNEQDITIPETIGEIPVRSIAAGAFSDLSIRSLILPPSLERVEEGAFSGCSIETLTLFDRITDISDASFSGCSISRVRMNAARMPVYSGSYFDGFSDRYDYLLSLGESRKLILFSGSSGRYGYDSPALERVFPEYHVVNMGVYAYTNALPQYEMIRPFLKEGDLLLAAPEFDAVDEQFCVTSRLDAGFWAMMESNYDAASTLDMTGFSGIFDSFAAYQRVRSGMESRSYGESPSSYDDDGNRYDFPTYNLQGDFILPRPNSEKDELHRHNIADYTAETVTPEAIDALDRELKRFTGSGIGVYFTYAPRNRSSLTERSTKEAREQVHRLLTERLSVPVISDLEDSLYSGVYFWNIDNHLSTEGVQIRTAQVIRDLKKALYGESAEALPAPSLKVPYPATLGLYLLVLLLTLLGLWKRFSWAGYAAGFVWAAATVAALLSGAPVSIALICTLPLLLVSACERKRGEEQ